VIKYVIDVQEPGEILKVKIGFLHVDIAVGEEKNQVRSGMKGVARVEAQVPFLNF